MGFQLSKKRAIDKLFQFHWVLKNKNKYILGLKSDPGKNYSSDNYNVINQYPFPIQPSEMDSDFSQCKGLTSNGGHSHDLEAALASFRIN